MQAVAKGIYAPGRAACAYCLYVVGDYERPGAFLMPCRPRFGLGPDHHYILERGVVIDGIVSGAYFRTFHRRVLKTILAKPVA